VLAVLALLALVAAMKVSSPAFEQRGLIPVEYTCDGANVSPPLRWAAPPKGTKSFALIVDDPDAPSGTFTHWLAWNISAKARGLAKGARPPRQGTASFGGVGYTGPCPPQGTHRYFFKLYALRSVLALPPGSSRTSLETAMRGKVLARATLVGLYARG
jgi:Raf kinase inhibitor-like YbhB/YbcL family protein